MQTAGFRQRIINGCDVFEEFVDLPEFGLLFVIDSSGGVADAETDQEIVRNALPQNILLLTVVRENPGGWGFSVPHAVPDGQPARCRAHGFQLPAAGSREVQLAALSGKFFAQRIGGFGERNVPVQRFSVGGKGLQLQKRLSVLFKQMPAYASDCFVSVPAQGKLFKQAAAYDLVKPLS